MPGNPLRGAMIGFGNVARHAHLPAWRQDDHFRIVGVVEPDPERARLAAELLPEARVYAEADPLFTEKGLDFVDICTPPCFHGDLILKACAAGFHVFCEKPLVPSLEVLHAIERASCEFGRVVFTVNNWKYAPLWLKTSELIHSGRLGIVRSISLTALRPPQSGGGASNWRRCAEVAGGGILLDHGWHHLYLIISMMGEPPLYVSATMEHPQAADPHLEETVDLVMPFSSGSVRLHLTWQASCRRNQGVISGDEGRLFINDDHLVLCANGCPSERYDFPEPLSGSSHHPEWMKPVLEDFLREVQDSRARGANWEEAKQCAELTLLAYQSHREGSRFVPVGNLTP
jgi:predicted dehydrogenase